jgi:hypothetical protein
MDTLFKKSGEGTAITFYKTAKLQTYFLLTVFSKGATNGNF